MRDLVVLAAVTGLLVVATAVVQIWTGDVPEVMQQALTALVGALGGVSVAGARAAADPVRDTDDGPDHRADS